MLRNGLYKATYEGGVGAGYGLAHLVDGRVYGGDMLIYFTGTFKIYPNRTITARLKSAPYGDMERIATIGMEPLFGRARNVLELEGIVSDDSSATLDARSKNSPGISLRVSLSLLSE